MAKLDIGSAELSLDGERGPEFGFLDYKAHDRLEGGISDRGVGDGGALKDQVSLIRKIVEGNGRTNSIAARDEAGNQ